MRSIDYDGQSTADNIQESAKTGALHSSWGLTYGHIVDISFAYHFRHPTSHKFWPNPDSKVHGVYMGPPGADRTQVGPMLALWVSK